MEGLEYLNRVGVVRNEDLPESMRPTKRAARRSRGGSKNGDDDTAYETGSAGTSATEEEAMGMDSHDVAEALMTRAQEEMATSQCRDIATAIRIPELVQGGGEGVSRVCRVVHTRTRSSLQCTAVFCISSCSFHSFVYRHRCTTQHE